MRFAEPLTEARLLQRYKRFLADVELSSGERVTAHCANPGAMLGLAAPGSRVLLSRSTNPARKLAWSWEMIEAPLPGGPQFVGINTMRPNALVAEAIAAQGLPFLAGYDRVRREVAYGRNSRVDFLLEAAGRTPCFLEVKNCHFMRQAGLAEFPDCVAARSAKHMAELADVAAAGGRAVVLFVVQMRTARFDVARDIDPAYDAALTAALGAGVELHAVSCRVTPHEVAIDGMVEVGVPGSAPMAELGPPRLRRSA